MASISSFFGLETALRGLQAHQAALDVTSHNITNADTPGYTRQTAELQAVVGLSLGSGAVANGNGALLGGGVDVAAFQRIRDTFADLQYRTQNTSLGNATTSADALGDVENALQEPSDNGISKLLSNYWDAWSAVSNQPEDDATKSALAVAGQSLIDGVQALSGQIEQVRANAQSELDAYTSTSPDVLTTAAAIAKLNGQIATEVASGRQPNDLLDQRDNLLDQLSSLGQVTVTDLPNQSLQIAFGNESTPLLVDGSTAWAPTPPDTTLYPMADPGGKLGALQDLTKAGGTLDGYQDKLNDFVSTLVTSVNGAYGGAFFDPAGTTGATFALDSGIAADPSTIHATATADAGANEVALAVSQLRSGAADRSYAGFVLTIGNDSREAQRSESSAQALTSAADDKRSSVSGVSLDEEMSNMIRFQRGYQASARTMTTMDQMLDTLINRTGSVGL